MKQRTRLLIASVILLFIVGLVLGIDAIQRKQVIIPSGTSTPLPAGSIPIYMGSQLVGGLVPTDLEKLQKVSFVDAEDGVSQEGWLLQDVVMLFLDTDKFSDATRVLVSSSSRGKSVELTWAEVQEPTNMVMFDLSNRGTLKLVSLLPKLDTREEWIQDVDKIEIIP